ncbi:urease accessory protein UreF [Priestia abyssalis]|uniref:urease accessory protein UreF n=1 Tax=Priestia abyssalis TaxID=1221450 RepID=UPI00195F10AF|nr:urease accessory protein UreF [Priestia abyssalis]
MIDSLLPLLQLCDSNFPSGAFSHSFGMETYIQEGVVTDAASFRMTVETYMKEQLVYTDGLGCKLAYEYLGEGRLDCIWELDEELFALSLARETREGTKRIGEQMTKLCTVLYAFPVLEAYQQRIREKTCFGHPAVVFALVCHELNISLEGAISACLYAAVSSLIQNAVRGVPLGQTDGQKLLLHSQTILKELVPLINMLSPEDLGRSLPGLEIAQMRHEQLHVRLFMS